MLLVSTELLQIAVEEVSGVDMPANLTPGWLFQKSLTEAVEGVVADASPEAEPLTVNANEAGAVRRFLDTLRKRAADPAEEVDMTKEDLLEILDARDARMAKSAADEAAAAANRENEIKAEAERLVAERDAAAVAAAAAAATEVVAEAEAITADPQYATTEQVAELSGRVEALVKALTGEDGDGGVFATVAKLAKASATRTSIPEPTSAETAEMAKSAAGAQAAPATLRSLLRNARDTGQAVILGADPEAR